MIIDGHLTAVGLHVIAWTLYYLFWIYVAQAQQDKTGLFPTIIAALVLTVITIVPVYAIWFFLAWVDPGVNNVAGLRECFVFLPPATLVAYYLGVIRREKS